MKVLIIPDVHLKPWMFERATEIMKNGAVDKAVCLMDIADDWGKEFEFELLNNPVGMTPLFQPEETAIPVQGNRYSSSRIPL